MSEREFRELEEICERNHQRVKWAEEYSDMQQPMLKFPNRKERERARKQIKKLRTFSLACAMVCGMGATFTGVGVAMNNIPTLVAGACGCLLFMIVGWTLEIKAEEVELDV